MSSNLTVSELHKILYIPQIFDRPEQTNKFSEKNLFFKTLLKRDYPQCLLDFKKTLAFKNVNSIYDISVRIKNYNYHSQNQLSNLLNSVGDRYPKRKNYD